MTDRRAKKWAKGLKKARLTNAERSNMLASLTAFMAKHPASEDALVRRMYRGGKVFAPEKRRVPFGFRFAPALLSILFIISAGGGVSYAAEGAVPGEVLYPVKVSVNENVRTVLTWGPEDRAAWQTERVERRLKEAETLASRGELTQEKSMLLADSVAEHTESLAEEIRIIEESGDVFAVADVVADASIALEARGEVLLEITADAQVSDDGDGAASNDDTNRIVDALRETVDGLDKVRDATGDSTDPTAGQDTEETVSETVSVPSGMIELLERRRVRTEEEIAKARAYVTENRAQLPELVASTAGRIIRKAEALLYEGEEFLTNGFYGEGLTSFYEAQRTAKRATVYAESNLIFEIEIPEEEVIEEPPIEEAPPVEELPVEEDSSTGEDLPVDEPPAEDVPPSGTLPPDEITV